MTINRGPQWFKAQSPFARNTILPIENKRYVSFLTFSAVYGCATTALVDGTEDIRFYILEGDHRAAYAALVSEGFDACALYFKANVDKAHKYSDKMS